MTKPRYRVRASRRFLSPTGEIRIGARAPNVRVFTKVTALQFDPEVMLAKAMNAELAKVVIVGVDKEGEFFWASSVADGGDCLWWLQKGIHMLMEVG